VKAKSVFKGAKTVEKPVIDGLQFVIMVSIICLMLLIGWIWFFDVVKKNSEGVHVLLNGTAFIQNLTVIGVVIMTGVLAIAGILRGDLAATLLSGVVGYVLGSIRLPDKSAVRSN
jgi:hypothetical protein